MRAERADLERLDRVAEVINRAGGRGEVQNVVNRLVDLKRMGNIVADKREARMAAKMFDVAQRARDEVVHADDIVAVFQETLAQMRADETRAACNDCSHVCILIVQT